ncbi:MAG: molybdopterin cofactor-binding domain-containing protein [bacterium]
MMVSRTVVGQSVDKLDGPALVTGQAVYTDDFSLPGMLFGKILWSSRAHARIRAIDTFAAERLPGVRLILHHGNVPRVAYTTAGQGFPEPSPYDSFIFDRKVRFVGDRVAAVFADNLIAAQEAVDLIRVEYEDLPAIFQPEEATQPNAPIIHDEEEIRGAFDPGHNLVSHLDLKIGDVEQSLAQATYRAEGTWITQFAQHVPMETHIVITYLDEWSRLVVRSSTQVPFHARRIISRLLDLPIQKVRVIKPRVGGGFGGKQEILLEDLCALATLRTRRPARIELSRKEEFVSARLMHPMKVQVRLGADSGGQLQAMEMRVLSNTGAYGTHGSTIFFNTGSKTLPLYNKAPHIRFVGDVVYTNLPVPGAYRGYGATEGYFALECAIDQLAAKMGMDPLLLRRKNHIREGETSPIFIKLGEGREGVDQTVQSCGLDRCIELGMKAFKWDEKRKNPRRIGSDRARGVGMSILMQGSSIPRVDMAAANLRMAEDGSFHLFLGATDIGTGSDTILAQIAAETIGLPTHRFTVHSSDTDFSPFDKGAYASSTTYLTGQAVYKAALAVRKQILSVAGLWFNVEPSTLEICQGVVFNQQGARLTLEEIGYRSYYLADQQQIEASASALSQASPPPFSAHFAEVEIDLETGIVRPLDYVVAVDCGVAINPELARGQVLGSLINGIGFALSEELLFSSRGVALNPNFLDYKILTSLDLPRIEIIPVETNEPTGPYGAKSVGEICINGPLPTLANAIFDATGIQMKEAPFTAERVWRALKRNE